MYDAEPNPTLPGLEADQLFLDLRIPGLDPVRARRAHGELFESQMLGRLKFAQMPLGRPSYWFGEQRMPDSRFALQVVCEVESDREPGPDHTACVVAIRRLQVQDAMVCAPLINARLQELKPARSVCAEDLVLTSIHLPPRPLIDARFELGFRDQTAPDLSLTVVFVRGAPRSVRIDSDA
jgi:hypothetical protein